MLPDGFSGMVDFRFGRGLVAGIVTLAVLGGLLFWGLISITDSDGRQPALDLASGRVDTLDAPDGALVTVHSDTAPACTTCTVSLWSAGGFGSVDDAILLRGIPTVEHDSRGRFYATVRYADDHELIVYDADGGIVRTVGRSGDGPGEFRSIWDFALGVNDTLYVGHDRRLSVYDSTGQFVRDVTFEPVNDPKARLIHVSENAIVLTQVLSKYSPDTLALPLHLYDPSGQYVRALGTRGVLGDFSFEHGLLVGNRKSRLSAAGSVWLKDMQYQFENLDLDEGVVRRVIGVRTPEEWGLPLFMTLDELMASIAPGQLRRPIARRPHAGWAAGERPTERRPTARPATVVDDFIARERSLIVLVHVASTDWADAVVQLDTTRYSNQSISEPGYRQQLYDTMVDVIDIESGLLLARSRVPGMLSFTGDGTLYRTSVDELGVINVEAFSLDFNEIDRFRAEAELARSEVGMYHE